LFITSRCRSDINFLQYKLVVLQCHELRNSSLDNQLFDMSGDLLPTELYAAAGVAAVVSQPAAAGTAKAAARFDAWQQQLHALTNSQRCN
jgi:hypothetical protein